MGNIQGVEKPLLQFLHLQWHNKHWIFLLVLFSAFIATKGMLTDNRYKGFKRLTEYGRTLIAVNVIMLIILIGQHYHNKYIAKIKDQEYQIKQDMRDSILKVRYDSSLVVMQSKFDASNI